MRRFVLIAALLAGVVISFAGARIEWDKTQYDFGAFNESEGSVTAEFTYRNTGDEPLVIMGARANCGCTTPTYSAEVLQPGETATLKVSYDPGGRPGRFEKKVYVDTNTDPKRSTLTIKGVSVGNSETLSGRYPVEAGRMRLAHSAALLGKMKRGEVKYISEAAYNASTDTLRPSASGFPKWLDVKALPEIVPPGEQFSLLFFINSDRIGQWDVVTDSVTVISEPGGNETYRMPVVVTVEEDFSKLSDKQLRNSPVTTIEKTRLEPVVLNKGKDGETFFEIKNSGKDPLKIRRVYTRTPGVGIDVRPDETVKAGKSHKVKVTLPGNLNTQGQATAVVLTVVTNDPVSPKTNITIPVLRND